MFSVRCAIGFLFPCDELPGWVLVEVLVEDEVEAENAEEAKRGVVLVLVWVLVELEGIVEGFRVTFSTMTSRDQVSRDLKEYLLERRAMLISRGRLVGEVCTSISSCGLSFKHLGSEHEVLSRQSVG